MGVDRDQHKPYHGVQKSSLWIGQRSINEHSDRHYGQVNEPLGDLFPPSHRPSLPMAQKSGPGQDKIVPFSKGVKQNIQAIFPAIWRSWANRAEACPERRASRAVGRDLTGATGGVDEARSRRGRRARRAKRPLPHPLPRGERGEDMPAPLSRFGKGDGGLGLYTTEPIRRIPVAANRAHIPVMALLSRKTKRPICSCLFGRTDGPRQTASVR
jgi:hypothetical protein